MGCKLVWDEPHYGDERFYQELERVALLHSNKSHDYAPLDDPFANFRLSAAMAGVSAWKGVMVRLADKWSRIRNLLSSGRAPANESIKDSLRDNAVYSLIGMVLMEEEEKTLEIEKKPVEPTQEEVRDAYKRWADDVIDGQRRANPLVTYPPSPYDAGIRVSRRGSVCRCS